MTITQHRIAPPDGSKEALKINIYERSISLNSQLTPVLPYLGPGAIVVTAALQRGLPGKNYGMFFHENSQEEVGFIAASNLAKVPLGTMMCAPKFHGVTAVLEDEQDPDGFLLLLIIQRQEDAAGNPDEQYEAFHVHCSACQGPLHREQFSADPNRPETHGSQDGDLFPMFSTIWGCYTGAQRFSEDESLRTCGKCGHVNEPFPHETWGWENWVRQNRAANMAVASMTAMGASMSSAQEPECPDPATSHVTVGAGASA